MDNRLVLTVLLVTLSWLSVGTYAQNNVTAAPGNNVTAAPGNNVTAPPGNMTAPPPPPGNNVTAPPPPGNMTAPPGNMTAPPPPGNMTAPPGNNMTAAPGNNMTAPPGNNMTVAPGNNVTAAPGNNMTAAPGNNVTAAPGNNATAAPGNNATAAPGNNATAAPGNNATAAPGNNATAAPGNNATAAPGNNMTAAPGNNMTTVLVTTVAPATTAPPLTPNTTVENLETPIDRTGCGTQQLCAAEPASCNPAVAGSCFFLSARQTSGQNFEFGLAGETDGYLAATLSSDSTLGGNDTTYVCANNNGVVAFFSALLNNDVLTLTVLNVNNVRGRVNGRRIQCTFAATVPDSGSATSRSNRASSLVLAISTGPFNSTSGALGAPAPRLQSSVVNLANPNTTIVNEVSNTTNATATSPPTMTTQAGNMTAAPGNNMTTAPGNNMITQAGNMTAAPGNNVTAAPGNNATAAPGNNATAAPGNNATAAPGNNVTAAPGNNVTAAPGNNATAAPGNNTTAAPGNNATAAPGNNMTTVLVTTVAPATTAPPLTPNTTVENLETPIDRTGCGTQQLCAAEPASCNPAVAGSCFFLSARQRSGQNFEFGLAGETDGYLAATLSSDSTLGGNDTTYVCANKNGVVAFFSALLNNDVLTLTVLNVNNVRGRVNGRRIQCTFAATVPDSGSATSRSNRASSLVLAISTGPFNSTSGALGAPAPRLQSSVVNLANPNTTIVNEVSNTTNATATSPPTMTTQAGNMTAAPGNNMTTVLVTTVAPATTAPPLTPNTTVENLETPIDRTGCGTQQLCAAEPASCNPAVAGSCFFLSARQTSGQNFEFGLAGESDGYIAATLSSDSTLGSNDTTYVCANNNSVVVFFSALLNNDVLTPTVLNVNSVRGRVNGRRIQCTFAATVPDSSTSISTRASNVAVAISTGPFNSTSGALGTPVTRLQSAVINLANPTNISNTATTTSPATMTTGHAITLQQSLMQAMLIAAGVLGLFML
ncbi:mucin-1-like [Acanthopagrus latus]|uniref:mucin-1-like n=1 Tax=Acanthopagrus latus TaxID=8177 RepID=UPI00187CFFB6|nr:mucin-1-like [Acanthopagrus latus]